MKKNTRPAGFDNIYTGCELIELLRVEKRRKKGLGNLRASGNARGRHKASSDVKISSAIDEICGLK